ncbi:MAG: hypothetical protein LBL93_07675 [Ruminococcus sp.]|jgi:hypothetical protein|nr:hypothetical protein [Ruminococcus sp.]
MNEQQFTEYMQRIGKERTRMGEDTCRKIVTDLPETADPNTIYYVLQDSVEPYSNPDEYYLYKMWHFHPEGDWLDWGNIGILKEDIGENFDVAAEHAEDSLDDAISEFMDM